MAIFQELGSAPAAMSATKMCDGFGLLPGHTVETADAEQAYINAQLKGAPTYIRLPRERLPKQFQHMRDPVFRLKLALYGHPDSGGHWEKYAEDMLAELGWKQISGGWRSCFWHPQENCFLVVYVDDFRMAGPEKSLPKMWEAIRGRIKLGETERSGKFLGCECTLLTREFPAGGDPWRDFTPAPGMKLITANCIEYNMEHFLSQSVDIYCTLAKISRASLKKVSTPFIDEAQADREWEKFVDNSLGEETPQDNSEGFQGVIPGVGEIYKRTDKSTKKFVAAGSKGPPWEQVIRRITRDLDTKEILEDIDVRGVPNGKLFGDIPGGPRNVETHFYYEVPPCTHVEKSKSKGSKRAKRLAGEKSPTEKDKSKKDKNSDDSRGALAGAAARVLMKVLYAARLARYDLLRGVGALASMITKWDKWQDRKLHKLMCYINSTLKIGMISWVSDITSQIFPRLRGRRLRR